MGRTVTVDAHGDDAAAERRYGSMRRTGAGADEAGSIYRVADVPLAEAVLPGRRRDMAVALAYEHLALRPRSAVNRALLRRAEGIAR